MTIYSENYENNWNQIIEDFHLVITKIWNDDLETEKTVLITNSFFDCVLRNAPNEAKQLLYKIQELSKGK